MNHSEPIIIALTGAAGAGKDTIAEHLQRAFAFDRIAFADALRREISEAWRIDTRMLTDSTTKEWPIPALAVGQCSETGFLAYAHRCGESLSDPRSPRWTMQQWGDYQRRNEPDRYAAIVARWIRRQIGTSRTRIVVTDLRFDNELQYLRMLGARVLRVHRTERRSSLAADTAGHVSEQHCKLPADIEICNDGSIELLQINVDQALLTLGFKERAAA